jgi:hypothetical protein
MSNILKNLVFNMVESYLEEESIFELVETMQLDEAVDTFNELPAVWKKIATKGGAMGGKDSKVEIVAATKKIKSANNILSVLRKSLRRDGAALVWIEMNGDPLVAINKDMFNEYTLLYPQGEFIAKNIRVKQYGTGKWDRRTNKYIPEKYYNTTARSFKPTEAVEKMWDVAYSTLKNINDAADDPKDNVWDLAQEMKFEVRMLTPDENRIELAKTRKNLRTGGGLKSTEGKDSIVTNRKRALERIVNKKIGPIVEKIKSDVEAEVNKALSGEKYDFKVIDADLQRINRITSSLQRVLKDSDVKLKEYQWSDSTEGAKLDYKLKSIMDALKDV